VNAQESEELLAFYRGLAPDNRGRYLREILLWDDVDLEYVHDYIQWLFPTFERGFRGGFVDRGLVRGFVDTLSVCPRNSAYFDGWRQASQPESLCPL
jgi:hypothetical protein